MRASAASGSTPHDTDSSDTRMWRARACIDFSAVDSDAAPLAAGQVAHDLGALVDVARLELLLVVLEPAGPVGRHPHVGDGQHLEDLVGVLDGDGVADAELGGLVLGHQTFMSPEVPKPALGARRARGS